MRTATLVSGSAWRSVALVVGVALLLWAALWIVSLAADSTRVPSELSASANESTVMVCKDGNIGHEGDSFFGRLFGSAGEFRCTDWHLRSGKPLPNGTVDWPSSPRR